MSTTKTTTEAPAADKPSAITVTLETPIQRGDTSITQISLRRPKTGELRGLMLADLLQMDVVAITKLLTRITDPALTKPEIDAMEPADFTSLTTEVVGFFVTKQAMAEASQSA